MNAVSAGAEVWRALPDGEALLAAARGRTLSGALVSAEEVAEVVFFFSGPAAGPIQGRVLVLDGGYSLLA